MTLTDILKSTDNRKARWGIKRASAYVSGFSGCLDGGACPASLLGVGGDVWADCIKRANETAVYANPSMTVKGTSDADLPDGAILTFDAVITSTRKDRDGDILESSGCTLDPRMPLLWQHLSINPIGKFMQELRRSKTFVSGKFAIADTPLGRDAATLVKFGALRISHGFMPIEFEPMEDTKGEHDGWRIRKFETFEASVVSIPSNVDAVILSSTEKSKSFAKELDGIRTVYGRDLLETDAVKQWARHFHDNRPVQGRGFVELPTVPVMEVSAITYIVDGEPFTQRIKSLDHITTQSVPADKVQKAFDLSDERIEELKDDKHICACQWKSADESSAMDKPCKCPECGHTGPMSEFMPMDGDDDDMDGKSVSTEQKFFAELILDPRRMREVRDRLNAVLEATCSQERADTELWDDLLAVPA